MLLSLHAIALLVTIATAVASQSQTHHKVRHKHNSLGLRGNHVNEIREAFDQYRNALHKNKLRDDSDGDGSEEYDDRIDSNSKFGRWDTAKLHGDSSKSRNYERYIQGPSAPASRFFSRNKRVFSTTKTTTRRPVTQKVIDEDDYEDDDNDTANRRLNDDSRVSSSHGSSRYNRDVS